MTKNREVSELLTAIANVLDLQGENAFKIKTYWSAARTIDGMTQDIEQLWKAKQLRALPGVGASLEEKISEYLSTGKCSYYERVKAEVPEGVLMMLKVPGLGPKRVHQLWHELDITTVASLEEACKGHKIAGIPRMGAQIEENILKSITQMRERPERYLLAEILDLVEEYKSYLPGAMVSEAGSVRRRKDLIRDVDILVGTNDPARVLRDFIAKAPYKEILAQGNTKVSIVTPNNVQVDVRAVDPRSWGAALQYFTGSKNHNIHLRDIAMKQGYKINEYEITLNGKHVGGELEADIYSNLDMQYIPPELRENSGEIELALSHHLPVLVRREDILGDWHCHTKWSDGSASVEEMVQAAVGLGYRWLAITDHSQALGIAHGMSVESALQQFAEIEDVQERYPEIRILKGIECDIRADGTLDYPDELLKQFDIVVGAVHSRLNQDSDTMTARIIRALSSGYVTILAHPTGRMLNKRDGATFDWESVFAAAKQNNVAIEINCGPDRLDVDDIHARMAKEMGLKLSIGTDAHSPVQLQTWLQFGLNIARRAGLTKGDLL